jgi:two-component system cell cycle sensor histidine kinase/response regulator CckA
VSDAISSWLFDEKSPGEKSATPADTTRLLLVEDNPGDARLVRENLASSRGAVCAITHVTSLQQALEHLAKGEVDVVLADLGLPDSRGIETAARLVRAAPDVPVVVLTGLNDESLGNQAIQRGAQDYLVKGHVDGPTLWRAVRHARERAQSARQANDALHQSLASQATLLRLLERNADGIIVASPEGLVRYANAAAVSLFRRSTRSLVGSPFPHRLNPNSITEVEVVGEDGKTSVAVLEVRVVEIEWEGKPALLASMRDLTERRTAEAAEKRMEDELKRAQRMEAVGRLAGGIAHDFNNLLTVMQGAAELATDRLGDDADDERDEALARYLKTIENGAARASVLTRQLLAVSRRQVQSPKVVDVHALLSENEALLRSTLGESVRIEVSVGARSRVRADPTSLREMLVNLALWARDAMPTGGTWAIETLDVDLDMDWCNQRVGVTPGRYFRLSFTDTGAALDERAAKHVFEPFAAAQTKGAAGLGLASAYGIVKQAGGTIEHEASLEGGNCFHVYLPRVRADEVEEAAPPAPAAPAPVTRAASQTILLIEDMAELRDVAKETLRAVGYQVIEARNGIEGLELWKESEGAIDLIVTDVMMPDMNGPELVAQVRETHPEARVLFISGYAADDLVHLGLIASGAPCLPKPFSTHQLIQAVGAILGEVTSDAVESGSERE